ncbi:hypothetical protein KCV03_g10309, partial [Aureobasidium melanogenum]
SMKVSLRFVIESPVGQEADRETSREVQPDGPAQQPWEQARCIVHEDPDQSPEDPLTIRVLCDK